MSAIGWGFDHDGLLKIERFKGADGLTPSVDDCVNMLIVHIRERSSRVKGAEVISNINGQSTFSLPSHLFSPVRTRTVP